MKIKRKLWTYLKVTEVYRNRKLWGQRYKGRSRENISLVSDQTKFWKRKSAKPDFLKLLRNTQNNEI